MTRMPAVSRGVTAALMSSGLLPDDLSVIMTNAYKGNKDNKIDKFILYEMVVKVRGINGSPQFDERSDSSARIELKGLFYLSAFSVYIKGNT